MLRLRRCIQAALVVALALALTPTARGAEFTLTSTAGGWDVSPGDGICDASASETVRCTFLAAVDEADALPGPDVIVAGPGTWLTGTSEPVLTSDITILGAGADQTRLFGGGGHRVLDVAPSATVHVSDADLYAGDATASAAGTGVGAGIRNQGTMTLEDVLVRQNLARFGKGGGIMNYGSMTIRRSTIRGNRVTPGNSNLSGGGIYNVGTLALEGVTLTANEADSGAAIHNLHPGSLSLLNTTIDGNEALKSPSALESQAGALAMRFVTVTGNTSEEGAAAKAMRFNTEGAAMRGVVVHGNTGTQCELYSAADGSMVNEGGNVSQDASCQFGSAGGNLENVSDIKLGPLADNGGPVATRHPLLGSPVLDRAGSCTAAAATDARGIGRSAAGACDAGAVEALAADLAVDVSGPTTAAPGATVPYVFTVRNASGSTSTLPTTTLSIDPGADTSLVSAIGCIGTGPVVCPLTELAPGDVETFTLQLKRTTTGTLSATGTLGGFPFLDPNVANNTKTASTAIRVPSGTEDEDLTPGTGTPGGDGGDDAPPLIPLIPPIPEVDRTPPTLRLGAPGSKVRRRAFKKVTGEAVDPSGVARVRVALAKRAGSRCRSLSKSGKLAKRRRSCSSVRLLKTTGTTAWQRKLARRLPAGRYVLVVEATDGVGNVGRRAFKIRVR